MTYVIYDVLWCFNIFIKRLYAIFLVEYVGKLE